MTEDVAFIYENRHMAQLVAGMHGHMRRYGYEHVQVPAIADVDLFLQKAGDQVIERLLTFERFGRQLALRPEFTALAAHRYATTYPAGGAVVRWQFNGSVFRENDTAHRYQQMSIGAELLGMASPVADAEMVKMGVTGLADVAALADVEVHIGQVGLLRRALAQFGLDERTEQFLLARVDEAPEAVMRAFDEQFTSRSPEADQGASSDVVEGTQQMLDVMLDATQMGQTMGGRSRQDIVRRMLRKANRALHRDTVQQAAVFLVRWRQADTVAALRSLGGADDEVYHEMVTAFEQVLTLLDAAGVPAGGVRITPGLVQDWNYYTGLVFRFQTAGGVVLGAGGRYDELVQLMGSAVQVPAIGFAYYVDDILAQYPARAREVVARQVYLWVDGTRTEGPGMAWAELLRGAGVNVIVVTDRPDNRRVKVGRVLPDGMLSYGGASYNVRQLDGLLEALEWQA